MTLSISRYVDAVTGVIGAQVVAARELIPLRFSNDPRLPAGTVATVDSDGTLELFGAGTPEADYASQVFGYVTPAPVRKVARMRWAPYVDIARPARIYGSDQIATLAALKLITAGSLNLTLGDHTEQLTGLDFSAAVTFADVASVVQTAIRAVTAGGADWATATVTYSGVGTGSFNLVGGVTGQSNIAIAPATGGTDIRASFGWVPLSGVILSPGADAQSPFDALRAAENVTDSFGTFSYPEAYNITLELALPIAQYVNQLNVKYAFLYVVNADTYSAAYAALKNLGGTALILNIRPGEYKEALDAAIAGAIDYNATNAVVNFMYRRLGTFVEPNDVVDDSVANLLDASRVNYYGTTATAGQKLSFYQRGVMCGLSSDPLDRNVFTNEQWFKSEVVAALLSLQLTIGSLSIDTGPGQIMAILADKVTKAKRNGTIRVGKILTQLQIIDITSLTGDSNAWRYVQTNGVWMDVAVVERVAESGVTEYVAVYTVAYAKNDVIRKIEGSHNLV